MILNTFPIRHFVNGIYLGRRSLKECLQQGVVTEAFLRAEMARNHVRHDALDLVERTPDLSAPSISPHYG